MNQFNTPSKSFLRTVDHSQPSSVTPSFAESRTPGNTTPSSLFMTPKTNSLGSQNKREQCVTSPIFTGRTTHNTMHTRSATPSKASRRCLPSPDVLSLSRQSSHTYSTGSPDFYKSSKTPSPPRHDRFIPDRSRMRVDLAQASIISAKKNRDRENDNPQKSSGGSSPDSLTPLQNDFRRRMRGALLDLDACDESSDNAANIASSKALGGDNLGPGKWGRVLPFSEPRPSRQNHRIPTLGSPYQHDNIHVLDALDRNNFHKVSISPTASPFSQKVTRRIPTAPTRILDAPELVDDYYLNLVSWGQNNVLAVALGQCVYLWDAESGDIEHLLTLRSDDDYVTSVEWCSDEGNEHIIAVGTNRSPIQLWDAQALKKIRTLGGHTARVGSLSWSSGGRLSSGGRDSLIIQHDVRIAQHRTSTYVGHLQEVCGLKWNEDGTTLASGGNENYLCLWDAAMSGSGSRRGRGRRSNGSIDPRLVLTHHSAAVKALAWCPFHRGLLASGGGTADRTIKFWNTNNGSTLNSIDTGSQVCSLLWSKHNKEICSSHGFSENQLILWRYPSMTKIQEFTGHTARVLHTEQSPDGACVVSAAADETLRFWDVFGNPPNKRKTGGFGVGGYTGGMTQIR